MLSVLLNLLPLSLDFFAGLQPEVPPVITSTILIEAWPLECKQQVPVLCYLGWRSVVFERPVATGEGSGISAPRFHSFVLAVALGVAGSEWELWSGCECFCVGLF